jgi:hypothetical protein
LREVMNVRTTKHVDKNSFHIPNLCYHHST